MDTIAGFSSVVFPCKAGSIYNDPRTLLSGDNLLHKCTENNKVCNRNEQARKNFRWRRQVWGLCGTTTLCSIRCTAKIICASNTAIDPEMALSLPFSIGFGYNWMR